jgi:hypothetical protein
MSKEHHYQARAYRGHPENKGPERDRLWIIGGLAALGLGGWAAVKALGLDQAFSATGQASAETSEVPPTVAPAKNPNFEKPVRQSFPLEEAAAAAPATPLIPPTPPIPPTETPKSGSNEAQEFKLVTTKEVPPKCMKDLGEGVVLYNASSYATYNKEVSGQIVREISQLDISKYGIEIFIVDNVFNLTQAEGLYVPPAETLINEQWYLQNYPPAVQGKVRVLLKWTILDKPLTQGYYDFWYGLVHELTHANFDLNGINKRPQDDNLIMRESIKIRPKFFPLK